MRRDLIALPDDSRVWVYQADQFISESATEHLMSKLYNFTMTWSSHGAELDSYATIFHYIFLVVVADPHRLPSGCSIDASVHVIEDLGNQYNLNFMDRMQFAYLKNDIVHTIQSNDLGEAYRNGLINDNTLFFDNLVNTKEALLERWILPLKESWHTRFL